MNFSRLKLAEQMYQSSRNNVTEEVTYRVGYSKRLKESLYNWRKIIQEEHPYVDVFPSTDGQKKEGEQPSKMSKMKKSKSPPKGERHISDFL